MNKINQLSPMTIVKYLHWNRDIHRLLHKGMIIWIQAGRFVAERSGTWPFPHHQTHFSWILHCNNACGSREVARNDEESDIYYLNSLARLSAAIFNMETSDLRNSTLHFYPALVFLHLGAPGQTCNGKTQFWAAQGQWGLETPWGSRPGIFLLVWWK